jgi:hypothetical protein
MADFGRKKGDSPLLLALAAGRTVREAAELAGVGERTVTRRLADPDFRRQVAEARSAMMDRALGKLADATSDAVATLKDLLDAASETARLGAAKSILELSTKLRETVELEQRIAALESQRPPALSANGVHR